MGNDLARTVVFFDVRDTLGEVDRPGHLIPYLPSTQKLLEGVKALGTTAGVITNLPNNVDDAAGREMVVSAELSLTSEGKRVTIGDFIPRDNIITNHEANADKPSAEIYAFAARKLGVSPAQCLFVGENYLECLGAQLAGMRSLLKPCPPGREFLPALQSKLESSATESGRQFEALLQHEHLLGERIFGIGLAVADQLDRLVDGRIPTESPDAWTSPEVMRLPDDLRRGVAYFVHLIDHFADPVHLKAEEAMIEVAVACGMDRRQGQWVFDQHDQARAYWAAMDVAWRRIQFGDDDDRFYALLDFSALARAFVRLFRAHAVRENNQLYPTAGAFFSDADDALVVNLIQHSGASDITPYISMVERAEKLLGISAS